VKAVTWQGARDVRVIDVPDPVLAEPTDAIIRVTSTAICGSDLHLYEVLGPFMAKGDILGHEPMTGSASTGWPRCTPRSRPSAAAARSRSAASTVVSRTRCR
jgi:hypothetical protein